MQLNLYSRFVSEIRHNRFAKKLIESSLDVCVFAKQVHTPAELFIQRSELFVVLPSVPRLSALGKQCTELSGGMQCNPRHNPVFSQDTI